MNSNIVKTKQGMPILRDFVGADGTPIVIDVTTGIGYYLYKNLVYPLQFGTSSIGAFSDGFSTGFS